jgi:hypothetical protein
MERERLANDESPHAGYTTSFLESRPTFNTGYVIPETVLTELKDQAPAGCVLCAIESWDEEEWD